MASTHFNIDKTTGSLDTTVKVTTKQPNTTLRNYNAELVVTKDSTSQKAEIVQYYRPSVTWDNVSSQIPTVSRLGGLLNLIIDSPYDFWIYQCPDNIGNLYEGKEFTAGTYLLALQINESESDEETLNTIQIAFTRLDGRESYETIDGQNGFKVQYRQEASVDRSISITPNIITAPYAGGIFNATLRLTGRAAGENVIIDNNESIDYVTLKSFQWRSNTSEYADITFEFEPNTSPEELTGAYYSFETYTDALHTSISLKTEANTAELRIIGLEDEDGNQYSTENTKFMKGGKTYILHLINNDAIMSVECDADFVHISPAGVNDDYISFTLDNNDTFLTRNFTITIYGNQIYSVEFFASQLSVARSLTIIPDFARATAAGGNISISVVLVGRYLEEEIEMDGAGQYLSFEGIVWDSPTSSNGTFTVTFEPNETLYARNTDYVMLRTRDNLSKTLFTFQEAETEPKVEYPITYDLSNAQTDIEPAFVDENDPLTLIVSPSDGYELSMNSFNINMNGDTITYDDGVLTDLGDGTWRIFVPAVYGDVTIRVIAHQGESTIHPITYYLDGVTLSYQPDAIEDGGTFHTTAIVEEGYDDGSVSVEVFINGDMIIADVAPSPVMGGAFDITVPNVNGAMEFNVFAAAIVVGDLIGIRFNDNGNLEFYSYEPLNGDVSIYMTVDSQDYIYNFNAGEISVETTATPFGDQLTVNDFTRGSRRKRIENCNIIWGDAMLDEEMSADFIGTMNGAGNDSYMNIIWGK